MTEEEWLTWTDTMYFTGRRVSEGFGRPPLRGSRLAGVPSLRDQLRCPYSR